MSTDSEKGDKKVQLSATIPETQLKFLDKYKTDNEYEDRSQAVRDAIALLQSSVEGPRAAQNEFETRFGLTRIVYPANGRDYSALLENAQSLTLVFNDMRRWLDNHRHREILRKRLIENQPTRILLLHPRSQLMSFVAKISNKLEIRNGKNRQVRDIERAVRHLCSGIWPQFAKRSDDELERFRIIGHRYFNTYTVVMTERECWVVWYPILKRYNEGVIFVFKKAQSAESLYDQFKNDIDELERVSVDNHGDSDLIKLLGPRPKKAAKRRTTRKRRSAT